MKSAPAAFRNTLTNYALFAVRLLEGVLLTRWLLHGLGREYYGFWSLLWSVFVYALLLDFGFGKAAQKYTAKRLFETDAPEYNRILSAIFGMHCAAALLIVGCSLLAGHYLSALTDISDPAELAYCAKALLIFGIGTALTFPLGMFNEVLVGLHKIWLRNCILLTARCVELAGIGILLLCGGRLMALVIFSVSLNFTAGIAAFFAVRHAIPVFRARPGFDVSVFRKLAGFSFFIYLVSIANLIVNKTDRLILSIFSGLGVVGTYQVGSRIPELVQAGTTQYQETLSPVAAALHGEARLPELRQVVFDALRYTALLATPAAVFAWLLAPQALWILFVVRDAEATAVCRLMLVSVWMFVVFRSVPIRILMMSGKHRFLAGMQIAEAAVKLTLCLLLVRRYGALGVEGNSVLKEESESFAGDAGEAPGFAPPAQSVMDEDKSAPGLKRGFERSHGSIDGEEEPVDFGCALDLKAVVGNVSGKNFKMKFGVEVADEVGEFHDRVSLKY